MVLSYVTKKSNSHKGEKIQLALQPLCTHTGMPLRFFLYCFPSAPTKSHTPPPPNRFESLLSTVTSTYSEDYWKQFSSHQLSTTPVIYHLPLGLWQLQATYPCVSNKTASNYVVGNVSSTHNKSRS